MGVRVGIVLYGLLDLVLLGLAISDPDHDVITLMSPALNLVVMASLWINLTVSVPARVHRWDQT